MLADRNGSTDWTIPAPPAQVNHELGPGSYFVYDFANSKAHKSEVYREMTYNPTVATAFHQ